MTKGEAAPDGGPVMGIVNVEYDRYARRRNITQDPVVNKAVRVRNALPRSGLRKGSGLCAIEILFKQGIDNVIGEFLRSWIGRSSRRAVALLRNGQTRTLLLVRERNVLDLLASIDRDCRRQVFGEQLPLIISHDDKDVRRYFFEFASQCIQRPLASSVTLLADFDGDLVGESGRTLLEQAFKIVSASPEIVLFVCTVCLRAKVPLFGRRRKQRSVGGS